MATDANQSALEGQLYSGGCCTLQSCHVLVCIFAYFPHPRRRPWYPSLITAQLSGHLFYSELCRCPRLFTYNVQRQAVPVVEFLQKELGFDQQQVVSTIKRFPHLLGYQVKAHLAPHLHYLKSLGISDEQLPQLILARPHVLVGQLR
jgi:hypothetical protein